MPKQLLALLFVIGSLALASCSSNEQQVKPDEKTITFRLSNYPAKSIYMYSCIGTRQMLIDSVMIEHDSATVQIPEGTPAGMYRFVLNEAVVDLLVSNEPIRVFLDGSATTRPVQIEQSTENIHLYDFLYAYNAIAGGDSITCEHVAELRKQYTSDQSPPLAKSFAELILAAAPCGNLSACLTGPLLRNPYTDELIKSIATNRCRQENARNVLNKLLQCSDSLKEVKHELYAAFWDGGIAANQPGMLQAVLEQDDAAWLDAYNQLTSEGALTSMDAGEKFPSSLLIPNFQEGSLSLYYLLIHDGEKPEHEVARKHAKKLFLKAGDTYYERSANELSNDAKRAIGYVAGTMVFMVGKNDVLADKWIGDRDILNMQ